MNRNYLAMHEHSPPLQTTGLNVTRANKEMVVLPQRKKISIRFTAMHTLMANNNTH